MSWNHWKPYVPVARRRRQAEQKMAALRKQGMNIQPIQIEGRKIAKTFWGTAWCEHLESFSDFENRLPRGRTYVRNGSVCHLAVSKGKLVAKVSGRSLYDVTVKITTLAVKKWESVRKRCAGQIGSLLELLAGKLSTNIMQVVTDRRDGLFPLPGEIDFSCSCPDWASMCKHVAAVLYGVGARLDDRPELLFKLRGVDHEELIEADAEVAVDMAGKKSAGPRLKTDDLSEIFGIEMTDDGQQQQAEPVPAASKRGRKKAGPRASSRQTAGKPRARKKTAPKAAKAAGRKNTSRTRRTAAAAGASQPESAGKTAAKKKTTARKAAKKRAGAKKAKRSTKRK